MKLISRWWYQEWAPEWKLLTFDARYWRNKQKTDDLGHFGKKMAKFCAKKTKNEVCQGEWNPFLDGGMKNEYPSENYEHLMHGFEEIDKKITILGILVQNLAKN